MSKTLSPVEPLVSGLRDIARKLSLRMRAYRIMRSLLPMSRRPQRKADSLQQLSVDRVTRSDLQSTLDGIVYDVVETLGYVAAMVATYEQGDTFPVRAVYIDERVLTLKQLAQLEAYFSKLSPQPISLLDPKINTFAKREWKKDGFCSTVG